MQIVPLNVEHAMADAREMLGNLLLVTAQAIPVTC